MAILTIDEQVEVRQNLSRRNAIINYSKAQINVALQAVEDWFESNRPSLNAAINTATSPLVLTPSQKMRLVAFWIKQKFGREGVS